MREGLYAKSLPFFVICDNKEVEDRAWQEDVQEIRCMETGLNEGVELGFSRTVIAHGNLPLAQVFTR